MAKVFVPVVIVSAVAGCMSAGLKKVSILFAPVK